MKRTMHIYLRLVLAQLCRVFSISSWLQTTSTAVNCSFFPAFLSFSISVNPFFRLLTNLSQFFSCVSAFIITIITNFYCIVLCFFYNFILLKNCCLVPLTKQIFLMLPTLRLGKTFGFWYELRRK